MFTHRNIRKQHRRGVNESERDENNPEKIRIRFHFILFLQSTQV
jgi:hypothetical protein